MNAKELGAMPVNALATIDGYSQIGMTLREHFAGLAMAWTPDEHSLDRERSIDKHRNPYNESHKPRIRDDHEIIAMLQVRRADALLVELAKDPN